MTRVEISACVSVRCGPCAGGSAFASTSAGPLCISGFSSSDACPSPPLNSSATMFEEYASVSMTAARTSA
jgi:hypothetical protein